MMMMSSLHILTPSPARTLDASGSMTPSPLRPTQWTINSITDLAPVLERGRPTGLQTQARGCGGVDRADYDGSLQHTLLYI